ncbi:hypothetical protein F5887DRAFT_915003 [Amanita rubescens]|nr:hypothetical protein F5887DRAFT_915003 [Amanita rubescens]
MMEHYLYLNRAELVLFPPISLHDSEHPSVVQVIIKTSRFATPTLSLLLTRLAPSWNRPQPSSLELATFYLSQKEITQAVKNVMHAHTHTFLPGEIRLVGQGYILHGTRKEWSYRQRLELLWGDQKFPQSRALNGVQGIRIVTYFAWRQLSAAYLELFRHKEVLHSGPKLRNIAITRCRCVGETFVIPSPMQADNHPVYGDEKWANRFRFRFSFPATSTYPSFCYSRGDR